MRWLLRPSVASPVKPSLSEVSGVVVASACTVHARIGGVHVFPSSSVQSISHPPPGPAHPHGPFSRVVRPPPATAPATGSLPRLSRAPAPRPASDALTRPHFPTTRGDPSSSQATTGLGRPGLPSGRGKRTEWGPSTGPIGLGFGWGPAVQRAHGQVWRAQLGTERGSPGHRRGGGRAGVVLPSFLGRVPPGSRPVQQGGRGFRAGRA